MVVIVQTCRGANRFARELVRLPWLGVICGSPVILAERLVAAGEDDIALACGRPVSCDEISAR